MNKIRSNLLCHNPDLSSNIRDRLHADFEQFAEHGLPDRLENYLAATYHLDVSTTYAGIPIKNPWGKASGQLSMTEQQVAEDAAAGLGFCVLKTVIAQDTCGSQSMHAWAIPESRMVLQRIRGVGGDEGWTVSWKGRGWSRPFDEYLAFIRSACKIGLAAKMLIVPSCKYHLPTSYAPSWKTEEYNFTTQMIIEAYFADSREVPVSMPLEKDFSPTLAGSDLATEKQQILRWLEKVPQLIRGAVGHSQVRVGLKLFNALFDDEFQLEMLRTVATIGPGRPDYLVYANRLFDPNRELEGYRGIAVGGPDLSQRNLRVLDDFHHWIQQPGSASPKLELSATGDISSGKMAVEYLLRGCSSFQMHTFFQLPATEYRMRAGSKSAKALHMLYFDPKNGFVTWALHVARRLGFDLSSIIRMTDLVGTAHLI